MEQSATCVTNVTKDDAKSAWRGIGMLAGFSAAVHIDRLCGRPASSKYIYIILLKTWSPVSTVSDEKSHLPRGAS